MPVCSSRGSFHHGREDMGTWKESIQVGVSLLVMFVYTQEAEREQEVEPASRPTLRGPLLLAMIHLLSFPVAFSNSATL